MYTKNFHSIYIAFSILTSEILAMLVFPVQFHVVPGIDSGIICELLKTKQRLWLCPYVQCDLALSYQWEAQPQELAASILRTLPCSATNSSERVTASWEMQRRCKAKIGKGTVSKTTQTFFETSQGIWLSQQREALRESQEEAPHSPASDCQCPRMFGVHSWQEALQPEALQKALKAMEWPKPSWMLIETETPGQ